MYDLNIIDKNVPRKESIDKVTGAAKYTNDYETTGLLYARMVTSPYAHAKIKAIEYENSLKTSGVRAVITGEYFPQLVGSTIVDRPPIAIDKVRYNGEPVAVVVADSEIEAKKAAQMIKIEYEPLPVVNSPSEAIKKIHRWFMKSLVIMRLLMKFFRNLTQISLTELRLEKVI